MSDDSKSQVRVASVKPAGEFALRIQWANGKKLPVDLRDIVHRLKGLRALRDPAVFARAAVGERGAQRGVAGRLRHRRHSFAGTRPRAGRPR